MEKGNPVGVPTRKEERALRTKKKNPTRLDTHATWKKRERHVLLHTQARKKKRPAVRKKKNEKGELASPKNKNSILLKLELNPHMSSLGRDFLSKRGNVHGTRKI